MALTFKAVQSFTRMSLSSIHIYGSPSQRLHYIAALHLSTILNGFVVTATMSPDSKCLCSAEYPFYILPILIVNYCHSHPGGISVSHLQSSQLDTNDYLTYLFHNNLNNKSSSSVPVVLLRSIRPIAHHLPIQTPPSVNSFKYPALFFMQVFASDLFQWIPLPNIPRQTPCHLFIYLVSQLVSYSVRFCLCFFVFYHWPVSVLRLFPAFDRQTNFTVKSSPPPSFFNRFPPKKTLAMPTSVIRRPRDHSQQLIRLLWSIFVFVFVFAFVVSAATLRVWHLCY